MHNKLPRIHKSSLAIPSRPIAGLAMGGAVQQLPDVTTQQPEKVPFQETWVEKRDREERAQSQPARLNALLATPLAPSPIAGPTKTPFQETWVEKRDREEKAQAQPATLGALLSTAFGSAPEKGPTLSNGLPTFKGLGVKRTPPIAGIAGFCDSGLIPGKVNPKVADDVTINAKKGEYILSAEVVAALGGAKRLDEIVKGIKEKIGLPAETGPKRHDQPDSLGRMDKPGLPAKGIAGLASGGPTGYEGSLLLDPNARSAVKTGIENMINYNGIAKEPGNFKFGATQQTPQAPSPPIAAPEDQSGKRFPLPTHDIAGNRVTPGTMTTPPIAGAGADTRPKIAPGMVSIAREVDRAGLPIAGTSLGSSTGGASVQLDGNKGLGDTTAISNRVDWSPNSANVRSLAAKDKYNEEVKRAGIANAILQGPKTLEQHQLGIASGNTSWGMSPNDQKATAAANFAAQEKSLADNKTMEVQKYGADAGLQGHKYTADQDLAGKKIAAGAHIQAAALEAQGRDTTAKASQEIEAAKERQKQRNDLAKQFLSSYDFTGISPTAADEYAGLLADTHGKGYVTVRDPSGKHGDILVHQNIEGVLRDTHGKIKTPEQFLEYLKHAEKLGGKQAPVYRTSIRNAARLPMIRSKQDQMLGVNTNG